MPRFFRFVSQHPYGVILLVGGLTALAATSLYDFSERRFHLQYDPSINSLGPADDEAKIFYDHVRRVFGSDETMLVAVHSERIFTTESLSVVKTLTDEIAQIDGVHHVVSISNAANAMGDSVGLDVSPLFEDVPTDPEELARLEGIALDNPTFSGNLLSTDGRTASILLYFLDFSDREFFERGIADQIAERVEARRGATQAWLTGSPYIKVEQTRTQTQ